MHSSKICMHYSVIFSRQLKIDESWLITLSERAASGTNDNLACFSRRMKTNCLTREPRFPQQSTLCHCKGCYPMSCIIDRNATVYLVLQLGFSFPPCKVMQKIMKNKSFNLLASTNCFGNT